MALQLNGRAVDLEGVDRILDRISFKPGDPHTYSFKEPPQGIALHWTGGEGDWLRVRKTLTDRELSVHFVIDAVEENPIVQLADLTTQCAHIGKGNPRFIGIEIANRGWASREDMQGSDLRDREELDWEEPRDVYPSYINGKRGRTVSFYPHQIQKMLWLVETLCFVLNVPRIIPYEETILKPSYAQAVQTSRGWSAPAFDRDWSRRGRMRTFKGVLGHFHLHKDKWDPGAQPFYALWAEGFNPIGRKFART